MKTTIGVIGLGNMGFGMSMNLLKAGRQVVVYDVRPEPMAALVQKGATAATSVKDLAQQCPVVLSVLLDFEQNRKVIEGADGLGENMADNGCIFVCSTISPNQARRLAAITATNGIRLLDCPISGGSEGAVAGTLSLMIGGDADAVAQHRSALEAVGSHIYHFGGVGAGQSAKAINQLLVAVNNATTAEAILLAAKSGLDLNQVHHLISNSAGNSWAFQSRAMKMIERNFESEGVLDLLRKDTEIVLDAAQSLGIALPLTTIAHQLYQAGVDTGLASDDFSAVLKVLENQSSDTA